MLLAVALETLVGVGYLAGVWVVLLAAGGLAIRSFTRRRLPPGKEPDRRS